jgi:uncharacterized protein (TIGR00661 family)
MNILYAIQGTGNGHLSRARDIIPILQKMGKLDLLVSGNQADVRLPQAVKYQLRGMSFIFGTKGGVDMGATAANLRPTTLFRDIYQFPLYHYDLIINDFEPVTAWACKLRNKHCVALSHQSAVLSVNAPKPAHHDPMGKAILRSYAPASVHYGFHFARFDERTYTPVIRQEIRQLELLNKGHYTVYLPAYSDETLVHYLGMFKDVRWEVFSKHNRQPRTEGNVCLQPVNNEAFVASMASSEGVLCGAGFETPAEALFLGKKLLVIPMKNQYEQYCNAAGAAHLGVSVVDELSEKWTKPIGNWLASGKPIGVDYPDETEAILEQVVRENVGK